MDSGHSRAAALMNAARRNHFVAGLQKYEAKARQGKAMGKKKQHPPLSDLEQCTGSNNQRRLDSSEKNSAPSENFPIQKHIVAGQAESQHVDESFEARPQRGAPGLVCDKQQARGLVMYCEERGGVSLTEQSMVLEQKEMITGMVNRSSSSSGIETITEGLAELDMTTCHALMPVEKVFPVDLRKPTSVYLDLQIPPFLELDITKIAVSLNIRIKAADMAVEAQEHAFKYARECLDVVGKHKNKYIASKLKKEFDNTYGRAWHCIVGMSFGSYVTHSLGGFVYFSLDKVSILLFKTTVEAIEF